MLVSLEWFSCNFAILVNEILGNRLWWSVLMLVSNPSCYVDFVVVMIPSRRGLGYGTCSCIDISTTLISLPLPFFLVIMLAIFLVIFTIALGGSSFYLWACRLLSLP
jgi:hypothetical protein